MIYTAELVIHIMTLNSIHFNYIFIRRIYSKLTVFQNEVSKLVAYIYIVCILCFAIFNSNVCNVHVSV